MSRPYVITAAYAGALRPYTSHPTFDGQAARSVFAAEVQEAVDCAAIGELDAAVEVTLSRGGEELHRAHVARRITFKQPPPECLAEYRLGRRAGF